MKSLVEIRLPLKSVGLLLTLAVDFTHYVLQLLKSKGKTKKTNLFLIFITTVHQKLVTSVIFLHLSLGRMVDVSADAGALQVCASFLVLFVNSGFIFLFSGRSTCHLLDKSDPYLLLAGNIFLSLM